MKIEKMIQKIALSGILTLSLTGSALAATAAAPTSTPADIQSQIGAQLGITSDSVNQLLNKLDQQNQTNDGLAHADYKIKGPQERAKVQAALRTFQTYLSGSLFPEVKSDLDSYNAIYSSSEYSDAQKQTLLANMDVQLKSLFENASGRYSQAVFTVIKALGPDFSSFTAAFASDSDISWAAIAAGPSDNPADQEFGTDAYSESMNELQSRYSKIGSDFYSQIIFPSLLNQCYSRSCISLSTSDNLILFTIAESLFGKPVSFKAADGTSFTLDPNISVPNDGMSDLSTLYVQEITRTDLYPQNVQNMPFDITEAQLGPAIAAAAQAAFQALITQRQQLFAGIAQSFVAVNNDDGSNYSQDQLSSDVKQVCEVGQGTENACQNGLGCPTQAEYQTLLAGVVSNSDLKKNDKSDWKKEQNWTTAEMKNGADNTCSK